MKKIFIGLEIMVSVAICTMLGVGIAFACIKPDKPTISSISVSLDSVSMLYDESNNTIKVPYGQSINLTNADFGVVANYSDGREISVDDFSVDTSSIPSGVVNVGDYNIVITYLGKTHTIVLKVIEPTTISRPTMDTLEYVYTGEIITPIIDGYDSTTMQIDSGSNTCATNVGDYTITIRPSLFYKWADGDGDTVINWKISKKTITKVTYDGYNDTNTSTYPRVTYMGDKIAPTPNGNTTDMMVDYSGVSASDTPYTVTYSLPDTDNYIWNDDTTESISYYYYIDKLIIDIANLSWNYSGTAYTYNGSVQAPYVTNIPEGVNATYTYTDSNLHSISPVNADTYTASVTFSYDNSNVSLSGTMAKCIFTIAPIYVNASLFTWNESSEIIYDGSEHILTLEVSGDNLYILEYIDIEYTGNVNTEIGNYKAVATITPKTSHKGNIFFSGNNINGITIEYQYEIAE